jgi:5'-phosphate synthase pdxT subunit
LGEAGFEDLRRFVTTKPTFGTCAGAIMLAKEVENPAQKGTGAIDIRVRRNAYGRQIESTILTSECSLPGGEMEMVYIRAPRIEEAGTGVEVLAKRDGHPVLVREGKVLAATFHPELTGDTRVHELFLNMVRNGAGEKA